MVEKGLSVRSEAKDFNLISNKTNSENDNYKNSKLKHCPNTSYYFKGLDLKHEKWVYGRVRCKKRSCPYCRPIDSRIFHKRVQNGVKGTITYFKKPGFRSNYYFKFLTLTPPGAGYRSEKSPEEADREMNYYFQKLIGALRKTYGWFEYLRVAELQKSGYTHYHVWLAGENIVPKNLHNYITKMWCDKYGMGFIKLNNNYKLKGVIWYMSKYISKGKEEFFNGSRLWSASKLLRTLMKLKKNPNFMLIEFGTIHYDENGKEVYRPMKSKSMRKYLNSIECSDGFMNILEDFEERMDQLEIDFKL